MDTLDKKILDIIQTAFPITERPYADLAKQLSSTEEEVFSRVVALKEQGIIRRIGCNFQSAKLDWHSTLCGAYVPEDKIEEFTKAVNALSGVTHNYLREHHFNIWFTLIAEDKEKVLSILADLTEKTGIEILYLPAEILYKIKVDFKMENENSKEAK